MIRPVGRSDRAGNGGEWNGAEATGQHNRHTAECKARTQIQE